MPSYKYPQLNNKDWLYEQYIIKSLSTNIIRDLIGCKASNTVRQSLIRYDIPVRNISDGLTINNPSIMINKSVIDGCLLGDAWLFRYNKLSDISLPYFIKTNKYYDHVCYDASQLYPESDVTSFISAYNNKCNGKVFTYYTFKTPVYSELMEFYNRWYDDGTRQPPSDLKIDSTTLLHWFMDDGSSYHRRRESKIKQVTITLSCEGFKYDKIVMLNDILIRDTELPFKVTKCNSGCGRRITLTQLYSKQFFDFIGPCPVKSFEYKWK